MPRYLRVLAGIALALTSSTISAKERSPLESASVKAATDCVASAALNNANIVKLYQQNRLKEVTDWIVLKSSACDNPLRAMRLLHDRLYGQGTGRAFLLGAYLDDLPRAVRERIKIDVVRRIASNPDVGGSLGTAPLPSVDSRQLITGSELTVVNIEENDVLNIREYATDKSRIIEIIPPNAKGVIYLGEVQGQWLFIRYENRAEGWVDRRFVQPVASRGRRLQR